MARLEPADVLGEVGGAAGRHLGLAGGGQDAPGAGQRRVERLELAVEVVEAEQLDVDRLGRLVPGVAVMVVVLAVMAVLAVAGARAGRRGDQQHCGEAEEEKADGLLHARNLPRRGPAG